MLNKALMLIGKEEKTFDVFMCSMNNYSVSVTITSDTGYTTSCVLADYGDESGRIVMKGNRLVSIEFESDTIHDAWYAIVPGTYESYWEANAGEFVYSHDFPNITNLKADISNQTEGYNGATYIVRVVLD